MNNENNNLSGIGSTMVCVIMELQLLQIWPFKELANFMLALKKLGLCIYIIVLNTEFTFKNQFLVSPIAVKGGGVNFYLFSFLFFSQKRYQIPTLKKHKMWSFSGF